MKIIKTLSICLLMSGFAMIQSADEPNQEKIEADDSVFYKQAGRYMGYPGMIALTIVAGCTENILPLFMSDNIYESCLSKPDASKSQLTKKIEAGFWTTLGIGSCTTLSTVAAVTTLPNVDAKVATVGSFAACATIHQALAQSLKYLSGNKNNDE